MPPMLSNLAALLGAGAIWALTPSMAKLALEQGMRPLGITALAAVAAAATLYVIALAKREAPPWDRAHLLQYATGGIVGLSMAQFFAFTGLQRAPAGLFALLVPLSAMFTVIFFALARIERATLRSLGGAAVGMLGVGLAMAPGAALPDPALLPWAAIMLLSPVCYAASNLFSVKFAVRGTSPLAQAAGTLVLAAAGAALVAWPLGHLSLPGAPWIWALLMAQGVLTALAYLLYFRLLVHAGGVFTSQISYVVTLTGLLWGFLLFAEVPGWLTIPAAALIFAGVALVTLEKRSRT